MLRAIALLEKKLKELYDAPLPKYAEEAQEQIRTIDDITDALDLLRKEEGIDE